MNNFFKLEENKPNDDKCSGIDVSFANQQQIGNVYRLKGIDYLQR